MTSLIGIDAIKLPHITQRTAIFLDIAAAFEVLAKVIPSFTARRAAVLDSTKPKTEARLDLKTDRQGFDDRRKFDEEYRINYSEIIPNSQVTLDTGSDIIATTLYTTTYLLVQKPSTLHRVQYKSEKLSRPKMQSLCARS